MYISINEHLRGIRFDYSCEKISKPLIQAISSQKKATEDIYYRGVKHFPTLDKLKTGDCFADKGFMSLSRYEEIAHDFTIQLMSQEKMVFEVRTYNAREIKHGQGTCERY